MPNPENHYDVSDPWEHEGQEQTEPAYFVIKPKYSKKSLVDNDTTRLATSLGQDDGLKAEQEREETEPELLTDPPEVDEEDLKDLSSQEAQA